MFVLSSGGKVGMVVGFRPQVLAVKLIHRALVGKPPMVKRLARVHFLSEGIFFF